MQTNLPVGGVQQAMAQAAARRTDRGALQLSAGDFLTLLIAELRNQDPFNPLEQKEMFAQLAQLQMVAELGEIRGELSGREPAGRLIGLLGRQVWWEDEGGQVMEGRVERVVQTPEGWRLVVAGRFVGWEQVRGVAE